MAIIIGTNGDDILQGGAEDDELDGGAGDDTLQGGLGNDTYHVYFGDGVDTIIDTAVAGTASFAASVPFAAGDYANKVVLGDVNGDGKDDLVVANHLDGTVSVLLNTTAPGATTPSFTDQVPFVTGGLAINVALGDVNGDGKLDLAVANWDSSTVSVLLNQTAPGVATPSFAAPVPILATDSNPAYVAFGDVNGDGKLDLVEGNHFSGTVSVLLNETVAGASTPSFAPQVLFAAQGNVGPIALGDLNGDGKVDMAVTNTLDDSTTVSVFLNQTAPGATTPSFAPQVVFTAGLKPWGIVMGDINGDDKLDLAVTNMLDGTISVLLNTTAPGAATPSFAPQASFAAGAVPHGIAIGDMNGDGKVDLVATNLENDTVSVLLNTTASGATTPSFTTQAPLVTGDRPTSVALGDLNGDGALDLAVSNSFSDTVSVLLNPTASGLNVLQLGPGITLADLTLVVGAGVLQMKIGTAGDMVQLSSFDPTNVYGPHAIETFQFADGTSLSYQNLIDSLGFTIEGTANADTLTGTNAVDHMTGLAGDDILQSGGGDDVLDGGVGDDTLEGGLGDDLYVVDNILDWVIEFAGEGIDTVISSSDYILDANVEDLILAAGSAAVDGIGNELDNWIFGNENNNVLDGGTGADTLDGGAGADEMWGGLGDDFYFADDILDVVIEFTGEGIDTVISSSDYILDADVEDLILAAGSAAVNGIGNELDNWIFGNENNNVLDGGTGADTLWGHLGNDTYVVGAGDTVVEAANEGSDLVLSNVTWTLGANTEKLTLTGTDIIDGTGNELNNTLIGNSAANVLTGGAGHDIYNVGTGDTVVEAVNEGTDLVLSNVSWTLGTNTEKLTLLGSGAINGTGNSLNNTLIGNSAANVLTGGAGHDIYNVGTGDTVVEAANEGTDLVLSSVSFTLGANTEKLTLLGSGAINGTGNSLNNTLIGNSAANVLTGGAGHDIYNVGTGDTVVEAVNEGTDLVLSNVSWTLGANTEKLTLLGTGTTDGTGNELNNTLIGNSAANVLTGGAGNDILSGRLGNDTYQVDRGEGQDTIVENDGTGGNSDLLLYGATINPLDLVLSQQANHLRIAIHGSTDRVTIQNWFSAPGTAQVETIQAGNGQTLLSTQVDQLIQAMATFSQQTGLTWDQAIDQQPQNVQTVLAANWQ